MFITPFVSFLIWCQIIRSHSEKQSPTELLTRRVNQGNIADQFNKLANNRETQDKQKQIIYTDHSSSNEFLFNNILAWWAHSIPKHAFKRTASCNEYVQNEMSYFARKQFLDVLRPREIKISLYVNSIWLAPSVLLCGRPSKARMRRLIWASTRRMMKQESPRQLC